MELNLLYILGMVIVFALGAGVDWHVRDRRQRMVLDWIDGRLAHINGSGHPEIIQRERDVSRETEEGNLCGPTGPGFRRYVGPCGHCGSGGPCAGLSVKMNMPDTPEFRELFERDTINKVNRALYGGSNAK